MTKPSRNPRHGLVGLLNGGTSTFGLSDASTFAFVRLSMRPLIWSVLTEGSATRGTPRSGRGASARGAGRGGSRRAIGTGDDVIASAMVSIAAPGAGTPLSELGAGVDCAPLDDFAGIG